MVRYCYRGTAQIGRIGVVGTHKAVTRLLFGEDTPPADAEPGECPLLREALRQITAYLEGRLRCFDLPLAPEGTPFMRRVWKRVLEVPYGTTASYGQIARAIGRPGAARAVGMANGANPIPILIPCHRIIGADGTLIGYGGGLSRKARLLEIERSLF
jgi:methylated-DNA-[protein]-cysteine S-methyltransferase